MKQITETSKTPAVLDIEVPVTIADRQVTEKDAMEAMKRAGKVVVYETYLSDLETIGIQSRKGTIKIQRGRAMVSQRRMEMVLEDAADKLLSAKIRAGKKGEVKEGEILMTPGDYAKSIQAFAQLSSKLTESQAFSVSCEEVYRPPSVPTDPDQVQNSFAPGTKVQPATTQIFTKETHIHTPPAKENA